VRHVPVLLGSKQLTRWDGIYCGPPPLPGELFLRWNLDPAAMGVVVALAVWSGHRRTGVAAVFVLSVAFISPLCALSSALFSARAVHHILLVAVAAPLLAHARPARVERPVGAPFLLATSALWLWHAPVAYDAALANMAIYWAMQASLGWTAFVFWRAAFSRPQGGGAGWVFLAYLAMGMLGALLTLSPKVLYATHAEAPWPWGLSPLSDQQLGGLIMWIPTGLPFAIWGMVLARRAWRGMGEAA
jgi:putative membrane protein